MKQQSCSFRMTRLGRSDAETSRTEGRTSTTATAGGAGGGAAVEGFEAGCNWGFTVEVGWPAAREAWLTVTAASWESPLRLFPNFLKALSMVKIYRNLGKKMGN